MLSESQKQKLQDRLLETCVHLKYLEDTKRENNASFNEQIKGAKKRVTAFSESLKQGNLESVSDVMSSYELDSMLKE
jgi:hypothetical protein